MAANTTPERADSTQKGTRMLRGNVEGIGSVGAMIAKFHIPEISKFENIEGRKVVSNLKSTLTIFVRNPAHIPLDELGKL